MGFRTGSVEPADATTRPRGKPAPVAPVAHAALASTGRRRCPQALFEAGLLIPIHPDAPPTACMSFDYHQHHLAEVWPLRTGYDDRLNAGCVGFSIDRAILALPRQHGLSLAGWPDPVCEPSGPHHV